MNAIIVFLFSFSILFIFLKIYFIEVSLIYNVVLISTVPPSDSVVHIYTHSFSYSFFIVVYHRILNRVPCAIQ